MPFSFPRPLACTLCLVALFAAAPLLSQATSQPASPPPAQTTPPAAAPVPRPSPASAQRRRRADSDAIRHAARRLRALPREQPPALLPPRHPRRPRQEVHQRQKHHPLPNAQGRHAHPDRPDREAEHRQDSSSAKSDRRSNSSATPERFSSIFRKPCARARSTLSISITPAILLRPAASAHLPSRTMPPGQVWINTACEGTGASIWWPDKDQWRDEAREHGHQRRHPQRAGRCFERQIRRARPISATATRAGTGTSAIPSITTMWR